MSQRSIQFQWFHGSCGTVFFGDTLPTPAEVNEMKKRVFFDALTGRALSAEDVAALYAAKPRAALQLVTA
jgi:hypothetical protein